MDFFNVPLKSTIFFKQNAYPVIICLVLLISGTVFSQDVSPEVPVVSPTEVATDTAQPSTENPTDNAAAPSSQPQAEPADNAIAPSSEEADKLADQAAGLIGQGKFAEAVELVGQNKDALASSTRLLERYIEALIGVSKPNWVEVEGMANNLLESSPNHPLAKFALGLSWSEKKKSDLAKALKYLAEAKNSPKPPPGIQMIYWKVWVKKNWAILVGAVAAIVVVITKLRQKRKTAKALKELETASGQTTAQDASVASPPIAQKADIVPEGLVKSSSGKADGSDKKPEIKPPVPVSAKIDAAKTLPGRPVAVEPAAAQGISLVDKSAKSAESVENKPTTVKPKASIKPLETKEISIEKQVVAAGDKKDVRNTSELKNIIDNPLEDLDLAAVAKFQSMVEAPRKPKIPAGTDIEAVWERLTKQALDQQIPLDYDELKESAPGTRTRNSSAFAKSSDEANSGSTRSDPPKTKFYAEDANIDAIKKCDGGVERSKDSLLPDPVDIPMDFNVTLDLSEDALKDDLLGKLKMLAIEDGELRTLLLQRNPGHIPHLIEFILTKPDPVRLAFVAREIGNYHDTAVGDVLASLLYHEDERVVIAAIQGLQATGGSVAVLNICPFIQSEIPIVAEAAKAALSYFGPKRIMEAFFDLPANLDERVREAGVFVLSRMRGESVTRILSEMLCDKSLKVRQKVMLAMAFQKDPGYLPILREFFRKASEIDKKLSRKTIVYLQGFAPAAKYPNQAS